MDTYRSTRALLGTTPTAAGAPSLVKVLPGQLPQPRARHLGDCGHRHTRRLQQLRAQDRGVWHRAGVRGEQGISGLEESWS